MVCARFMRRAQAGGELLEDDAEADVEADATASGPAELPSPVAARLPPPSKLLLRLPAARRSGLITASAPLPRPLVATPDAPPPREAALAPPAGAPPPPAAPRALQSA